ncbi:hypothetical protein [Cohnella faecalis]|uniref:Uncharacterized protein n=1 Tax=Cohnella faecalis TaxID=2315694 RepID=A0A398D008_9BACL|nr:hypothetical protein [Cohnella faecalis]RIE05447.1 hypothetical protein D3H35_00305 [Cohnella faecalis]
MNVVGKAVNDKLVNAIHSSMRQAYGCTKAFFLPERTMTARQCSFDRERESLNTMPGRWRALPRLNSKKVIRSGTGGRIFREVHADLRR